jgi:hypothetical protein
MVKGGSKLNENERMALAQVALITGLNPFIGEVWYIPGSGPMVGIAGARKLDNERVESKGGYTWETCDPVAPEEAGASAQEAQNVAAAFKITINDSNATAQYQKLFADTLKMLRDVGTQDPFVEAKEICGPRPAWVGYGFSLRGESSRMGKVQLARKRAHSDALKKRIIVPFGGQVAETDAAPGYDVDAEAIDMEYPEKKSELQNLSELGFDSEPPIYQATEEPRDTRVWSKVQKDALINSGQAKNDFAAKGMLGLSNLPIESTALEIQAWGAVYRANRLDENGKEKMSAAEAAKIANEQAAPA